LAPLLPSSSSNLSTVFPITPRLNLAFQFNEGSIGVVEALCQHRCHVKQRERLHPE
jgi:hypothetical protein